MMQKYPAVKFLQAVIYKRNVRLSLSKSAFQSCSLLRQAQHDNLNSSEKSGRFSLPTFSKLADRLPFVWTVANAFVYLQSEKRNRKKGTGLFPSAFYKYEQFKPDRSSRKIVAAAAGR